MQYLLRHQLQPPPLLPWDKEMGSETLLVGCHLAANAFIAGERVTIADILAVTAIDFARMVKFRPDESLKNVVRWHAAMMARPAALAGV